MSLYEGRLMRQKLFTELRTVYSGHNIIRIRIRMRDLIDPDVLRSAVDLTMARYPYFCVEMKRDPELYFASNERPVVITNSLTGVKLNTVESNHHLIAFSYSDNWIIMDISHALTDGTGAYEVVRTFLYYYVGERYGLKLSPEGIRTAGQEISVEEWEDPLLKAVDLPVPRRNDLPKALDSVDAAGLQQDRMPTVYSIAIPENEFMRFNIQNDGSPATMVSLFLSRAIHRLNPKSEDPIRIVMAINQRKALKAPLAHQSLVGGAMLEYKKQMWDWPLDKQATAYRGMVFAQSMEEKVLEGVASKKSISQLILSKSTDQERTDVANMIIRMEDSLLTAVVSYVGKANYGEAEKYIRDFRLWTHIIGKTILIEISAVNGRFTLDFMQPFANPIYLNSFLNELDENGITYDLQDVMPLKMPRCAPVYGQVK